MKIFWYIIELDTNLPRIYRLLRATFAIFLAWYVFDMHRSLTGLIIKQDVEYKSSLDYADRRAEAVEFVIEHYHGGTN